MKWLARIGYILFLGIFLAAGTFTRIVSAAVGSIGGSGGVLRVWQGVSNPRSQFPPKDRVVVLLVGEDYRRDSKGRVVQERSRSDTIMMLSIDMDRRKIHAVSIPRDTYVRADDGISGKINGVYARGGLPALQNTLSQMFGVEIDYTLAIKPNAVRNVVDAVGGVTVETIDKMVYRDMTAGLDINLPEGRQHLNGRQAEGYVRFREVNRYGYGRGGRYIRLRNVEGSKEEGDIRRTARQQLLIAALMEQAMQPGNLVRADQLIETAYQEVETTLSPIQILALLTIFRGSERDAMMGSTLPGSDDSGGGAYYWRLDEERAQAMVDWLVKGDESAMRRLTRVTVKNGSGKKGLGRVAASLLENAGFNVRVDGTAEKQPTTTVVFRRAAYQEAAKLVQQTLQSAAPTKDPDVRDWIPEVEVIIGEDQIPHLTVPDGA